MKGASKGNSQHAQTIGKSDDGVRQLLHKSSPRRPRLLKLEVKVSKTQKKRLVVDLNLDDPWHKVKVFSAINCLSKKQQECLNEAIRASINVK